MSAPLDLQAIGARWQLADMAIEAAVDAQQGWDEAKINAVLRSRADVWDLHQAAKQLIEALRLTQEYVGPETLPPVEGWSWYDALVKWAPEVAEAARTTPAAKHRRDSHEHVYGEPHPHTRRDMPDVRVLHRTCTAADCEHYQFQEPEFSDRWIDAGPPRR